MALADVTAAVRRTRLTRTAAVTQPQVTERQSQEREIEGPGRTSFAISDWWFHVY